MAADEFESIQQEGDPLRQARRATELLHVYQQRGVELARLRKDAIERAVAQRGMTYQQVAADIGLSKGRITQIRRSAPPAHRAFFGVGPITLALPVRSSTFRPGGVVAVEDAEAADLMTALLTSLAFTVQRFHIPPDGRWQPTDQALAICGPKSSVVTAEAIDSDPWLTFRPDPDGRWVIRDRATGRSYSDPTERDNTTTHAAYVGRVRYKEGDLFIIAGVHALGSLGAVHYLQDHVKDLYETASTKPFSMVVASNFADHAVTDTRLLCPPRVHA